MNATTVAADLAKSVFQLAIADDQWRLIGRERLTRGQFERWFANREVNISSRLYALANTACLLCHLCGALYI